jgi:hypothetical protein
MSSNTFIPSNLNLGPEERIRALGWVQNKQRWKCAFPRRFARMAAGFARTAARFAHMKVRSARLETFAVLNFGFGSQKLKF